MINVRNQTKINLTLESMSTTRERRTHKGDLIDNK